MLYGEDYEGGEAEGEIEQQCTCDPCTCETPGEFSPVRGLSKTALLPEDEEQVYHKTPGGYQLDEFMRAKEYFMKASTQTGISLYDHLSELIRKLLDTRNPPNVVDFVEEISMNLKRYRFGMKKDVIRNSGSIPGAFLQDSVYLVDSWRRHALWSIENSELLGEDSPSFGGFPNLMRLLYYLEQVNVGLPREEMLRIALAVRQLTFTRPVSRARFWGKIIGLYKDYYIVEAELKGQDLGPVWVPQSPEPELALQALPEPIAPGSDILLAGPTFERAGHSVLDPELLTPYQETSGLPMEVNAVIIPKQINTFENEYYGEAGESELVQYDDPDAEKEQKIWLQYQNELMTGFPKPLVPGEPVEVPPEPNGTGLNRRAFYVCNDLHGEWLMLPDVTPQEINTSRKIRWFLTGDLDSKIKTLPTFPGTEGNYLRALLARITAGALVSPRGYFRTRKSSAEYDGEDDEDEYVDEEEEEEQIGNDTVYPVKKFRPPSMTRLLSPTMELWVHHTAYVLRQGRAIWWNPPRGPKKEFEGEDDEEYVEEEEEEEENPNREIGPVLFSSLAEDKSLDGVIPWSPRASSSVFTEFQVASIRSNLWPGSTAICTSKGKVENIYIGDGLKFSGRTYSPDIPEETATEYIQGPELMEVVDPTVEMEQKWLKKLELKQIADIEDKFVDNEEPDETEEDDYDEDVTEEDD